MVTIKQLQREKAALMMKRTTLQKKNERDFKNATEIRGLRKDIKKLKRTPGQIRNAELARRIGRGSKALSKKLGSAAIKQGKLLRDQQLRDNAQINKNAKAGKKAVSQRQVITITKRKGKKPLRTIKFVAVKSKKSTKKISNPIQNDFFAGLPSTGGL